MGEGRREKSRERRRAAIEHAALQLFAEKGYEAATLIEIAEAADVSTRTLTLYFPSKLDLALSYGADAAERLSNACAARSDESVLAVIRRWLRNEIDAHGDSLALHAAMLAANPALRGSETPRITQSRRAVESVFAADIGRDPGDAVVTLAVGALVGVISALFDVGSAGADLDAAFDASAQFIEAVVTQARRLGPIVV